FRIDHLVGLFRIWTIPKAEPPESGGLNGVFDPPEEWRWEEHGRKIIRVMLENTVMLPCAEDLGVVPECSYRTLGYYHLPGTDIQRWARDWGASYNFKPPDEIRANSVMTLSTHDMMPLTGWWQDEAGTADEELFKRLIADKDIDFEQVKDKLFDMPQSKHKRLRWKSEISSEDLFLGILDLQKKDAWQLVDLYKSSYGEKEKFWRFLGFKGAPSEGYKYLFAKQALLQAHASASIFSIQLLQDWLSLDAPLDGLDPRALRINYPGTVSPENWSFLFPMPLEEMKQLKLNKMIRELCRQTSRC
ncbi:MAG: 4-alpha-glucanotransferase, partial [Candidatus Omnitrophica bacterium]|nr:4-alpha-glucanotransferase [Candidatus Omnitrophota bacterium]